MNKRSMILFFVFEQHCLFALESTSYYDCHFLVPSLSRRRQSRKKKEGKTDFIALSLSLWYEQSNLTKNNIRLH